MKRDDLEIFYTNIVDTLKNEEQSEKFIRYFYNSFLAGDTTIYQKNISEFKNFDNEWIEQVELYLPSLEKIMRNPKSTLRYDEEIIIIEKAKKVTSTSIRHLSANSHLIKDVAENGDIIPKKILTSNPEIDYGIYENRFIMTLIHRLNTFVGNRFEVIKSNIQSYQRTHLNFTSNFDLNNNNVNLNIDLVLRGEVDDNDLKQRNEKLLERVTKLVRTIHGLMISPFMRELAGKKPVIPPIMKTNIILKNPDFRNAYNLWLFLDKYNALVYDIDVQEKDLDIDAGFVMDLNQVALLSYAFILYNQENRRDIYAEKETVQYVRKATKIVRTNPRDVVENPDAIAMEDNSINEYYLDQNQRLFKKSLVDLLGDNMSYEDALKTAMKQTMDITNNLYKSVFELNPQMRSEADDTFEKNDIEQALSEAKKRAEIAKIVRETKEADFKTAIEMEREQIQEMSKLSLDLIKEKRIKKSKTKDKNAKDQFLKEEKSHRSSSIFNEEKKKQILQTIEELSKMKKDLFEEELKIKQKMTNEVDKTLMEAEKERAKIERQEELRRLKEERRLALEQEREMFRIARDKIRDKYKELRESIVDAEKAKREEEINKLKEKYNMIREQELEKVRLRMSS